MLLVGDSMTREVVTTTPGATAAEALTLCRERRIRHIPVTDEGGRLVGIVSDRDLRSATPALGDPARAEALENITVAEVMQEEVVTTRPDEPIERAANEMRERGFGSLPVVEEGEMVGIVTTSDVMQALVHLVGAHEPGSRLEVSMPDRPGAMAEVAGVFGELGVNLVSVVTAPEKDSAPPGDSARAQPRSAPRRVAVLRVDTIDPARATERLESTGYKVLWPPKTGR